jgi:hypothetical protein
MLKTYFSGLGICSVSPLQTSGKKVRPGGLYQATREGKTTEIRGLFWSTLNSFVKSHRKNYARDTFCYHDFPTAAISVAILRMSFKTKIYSTFHATATSCLFATGTIKSFILFFVNSRI